MLPGITMRYLCHPFRPIDVRIEPLGSRDLFQNATQIYRILLTYNFTGICLNLIKCILFQFTNHRMYALNYLELLIIYMKMKLIVY
jgi:hypothetical protein